MEARVWCIAALSGTSMRQTDLTRSTNRGAPAANGNNKLRRPCYVDEDDHNWLWLTTCKVLDSPAARRIGFIKQNKKGKTPAAGGLCFRKTEAPAARRMGLTQQKEKHLRQGGGWDRQTKTKAPAANLMWYICSHKTNNLVTLVITYSTDTRKRPGQPKKTPATTTLYLHPMTSAPNFRIRET
jgi:hypothetical protein